MQVAAETFQMWDNGSHEKITDTKGTEEEVWILHAPFCAIRCINDAKQFSGDTTQEIERLNK